MSPLKSSTVHSCLRKQLLFTVRTIRNTQMHSVARIQSFSVIRQMVHVESLSFKWLIIRKNVCTYSLNWHTGVSPCPRCRNFSVPLQGGRQSLQRSVRFI
jgi:hypothetical protein